MVYYLKYRPQILTDLIGQENIVKTLSSAVSSGKLSHAYLFVGPRGVGKTSTARILAKMVNCENGGADNCDICRSITDGSNLDLIEIDAASNRGIDDIRDLKEKIKLSPSSLKKKVYIIDEVHMLTTEAFNALLKTLEEPPAHVLFILATTEVHKLPATILSRVTRLDFKEANSDDLRKDLERIIKGEKLSVEDEALDLIVKKAQGSFRDGEKILEQLSSLGKITREVVEDNLNSGSFESGVQILEFLAKNKSKEALELLNKQIEIGVNLKEYLITLLDLARSLLLINQNVSDRLKKEYSEDRFNTLTQVAGLFDLVKLSKLLDNLQKAYEQMKFSPILELPLQVAIVDSCSEETKRMLQEPIQTIEESKGKKFEILGETNSQIEEIIISQSDNPKPATVILDQPLAKGESSDLLILKDKWNYVLETIKPYNFSLEAMLRSVKLGEIDNGVVILKVPYSFHQRILETPRNRDLLESILSDVLGKEIKVGCVLEQKPVRVEELANVELAADDEVIRVAAEIFSSES